MSKILIIYTGGTIGMRPSDKGYVPIEGFDALLRDKIAQCHHPELPEYDLIEFSPLIDSANLHPDHWHKIIHCIIDHYADYSGFILLHGTDTMAYTASALSFALQGLDKTVILTGSQIPLAELRNDALDNLIGVMQLAQSHAIGEVCVYFNGRLLRGNRACKVKATGLDAFDSPNFPWLGQVGLNITLQQSLFLPQQATNFANPSYQSESVCVLPIYPGMSADVIQHICHNEQIKGLILRSYGVGNLPDSHSALIDNLAKAYERGCAILNISQCLQADIMQGQYACSAVLDSIGVISGGDMTLEAGFAKLHYLIATQPGQAQINALLAQDLAGEISLDS